MTADPLLIIAALWLLGGFFFDLYERKEGMK